MKVLTWVLGAPSLLSQLLSFVVILTEGRRMNICPRSHLLEPQNVPKLKPPESQVSTLLFYYNMDCFHLSCSEVFSSFP